MKRYKKLISAALACMMLLTTLATTAFAAGEGPTSAEQRKKLDIDAADKVEGNRQAEIDVWAYKDELPIYAVDVEWGEMTFQYVPGTWDPENMKLLTEDANAPRWLVFNNAGGTTKAIEKDDDAPDSDVFEKKQFENSINGIKVSNRSNYAVKATLAYTTEGSFGVTEGTFTKGEAENTTTVNYKDDNKTILLAAATPGVDGVNEGKGTAAEGIVYFMPAVPTNKDGLANLKNFENRFDKIGKITVTVATSDTAPTAA